MNFFEILFLVIAIIIILALFLYLLTGEICYRFCLKRQAFAEKIINFEIDTVAAKLYKIDFKWWEKHDFEKVCVKGYKGAKLYPLFLKVNDSKKVAIIIHGYFARYVEMNKYSEMFLNFGFNLVVTQNLGHGESEGAYVGMGWLDRLDILKIIDEIIQRFGNDCEIVIFGLSMGGATVCMLAGEKLPPNVTHLISDCGYTNVFDEFKFFVNNLIPIPFWLTIMIFNDYAKLRCGYSLKEADSTKQLPKCKIPILFIHGKEDRIVPYEMQEKLYKATPKHLRHKKSFAKAGHAECLPAYEKEYNATVLKFLNINKNNVLND